MIGERELERRAASLGISVQHAERDYVLNHLLARFAREPSGLVFRGGTALARVYWPDYRISEDLDFLWPDPPTDPAPILRNVVDPAAEATGLDLQLVEGRWRDNQLRSVVRWTTPLGHRRRTAHRCGQASATRPPGRRWPHATPLLGPARRFDPSA